MSIFDDWRNGTITNTAALHALTQELGEVESTIAPLELERVALREQLSYILAKMDETVTIPGFGKLELTRPSVTKGYDKKQLDQLIIDLTIDAPELAALIAQCRTTSERAGSLRITREKGSKE